VGVLRRDAKGSHRNLTHPSGVKVTISGGLGDEAKPYQERDIRRALREAKR